MKKINFKNEFDLVINMFTSIGELVGLLKMVNW
jgi:hypothetical protein